MMMVVMQESTSSITPRKPNCLNLLRSYCLISSESGRVCVLRISTRPTGHVLHVRAFLPFQKSLEKVMGSKLK